MYTVRLSLSCVVQRVLTIIVQVSFNSDFKVIHRVFVVVNVGLVQLNQVEFPGCVCWGAAGVFQYQAILTV